MVSGLYVEYVRLPERRMGSVARNVILSLIFETRRPASFHQVRRWKRDSTPVSKIRPTISHDVGTHHDDGGAVLVTLITRERLLGRPRYRCCAWKLAFPRRTELQAEQH